MSPSTPGRLPRRGRGTEALPPCGAFLRFAIAERQKAGTMMDVFYIIPAWLMALILGLLVVATVEGGYRLGCRTSPRASESSRGVFAALVAAVLGLLGLLLAFSFAMAAARYDLRTALVLREANAIGTAYLRTSVVEEPAREQIQGVLRAYVDARIAEAEARSDQTRLPRTTTEVERLQRELWALVGPAVHRDPHAVSLVWVAQALNEVSDLRAERAAAQANHVPETVIWLLGVAAVLTGLLSGYACGTTAHRQVLATSVLAVVVTLVVWAILDLDRPQRGLIRVQQQAMRGLRERMQYEGAR